MEASAGVDALDPEGAHVALLGATIAVGVLQGLLHPFPGDPYAILCPSSESLGELEDLVLVHLPPRRSKQWRSSAENEEGVSRNKEGRGF